MKNKHPLELAKTSLLGLSVGDAFGETFFGAETVILDRIQHKSLQEGAWLFTDDTVMGIGVYNILARHGEIHQDELAREFAANYLLDDYRGYGGTAHTILKAIAAGDHWRQVSSSVFDGMGSLGNGAAMRSAPIGAYFHDDIKKVIKQATLAATITHVHPEAVAGAVAVALAASICIASSTLTTAEFFDFIVTHTPESDLKYKIKKAATLPAHYDIRTIVAVLGNGTQLSATDTVPFALWCAAHHLTSFEEALWTAVSGLGDRDTIAAITGSIVVLSAGEDAIPGSWLPQTEQFDSTPFFK
ncbi:ADP-ribosylglycohydrolase family protein [Chitinophaga arvensicola]|uniref:ADP-ribosylglycohydrolase n=1 Tax=Chitinophaga arvensicola TaxID=29529 RepID=A0A1I0S7K1_9BACT|nr:ADP-ribosylglycohydrolase family protein [Chitinophaga arvensicola]SEW51769.1 ADP-ribosylglycohydrolase [Chitinophaga arvensicola]